MTNAEKYCARKVAGKLTRAIEALEEAKDAAKQISPEVVATLQADKLVPILSGMVRDAIQLRRGLTPRDPPAAPAVPTLAVVKNG